MDNWRTGGNQDIQGYLQGNRRKPGYPWIPGEKEETRIFRDTWRTGGNKEIQRYMEKRRKPVFPGVPGEQEGTRISMDT